VVRSARPVSKDARLAVAENVHYRQFDDEIILLDLSRGEYFALNPVASRMWGHLVAGQSPGEIADLLQDEYDVGHQTLVDDCVALATQLVERGLLSPVRP
jgi:hypothetical protein